MVAAHRHHCVVMQLRVVAGQAWELGLCVPVTSHRADLPTNPTSANMWVKQPPLRPVQALTKLPGPNSESNAGCIPKLSVFG